MDALKHSSTMDCQFGSETSPLAHMFKDGFSPRVVVQGAKPFKATQQVLPNTVKPLDNSEQFNVRPASSACYCKRNLLLKSYMNVDHGGGKSLL